MGKMVWIILRVLVLSAAGIAIFLYFAQNRLIYYRSSYGQKDLDFAAANCLEVPFTTSQGRQSAWFFPKPGMPAGVLPGEVWLVFGGNASVALGWVDFLSAWRGGETGFLLFDYPGFGKCEGTPGKSAIGESIRPAVLALAKEFGVPESEVAGRVCVLGHSLGAAAGLMAAVEFNPRKAVIISPFTSLLERARQQYGTPLCHLLKDRYDNVASLRLLDGEMRDGKRGRFPLTVLHGSRDRVIPVTMGRELAAAFGEWIEYVEIPGAGHNDILLEGGNAVFTAMRRED